MNKSLRESPYSKFFGSVFSRIPTEYGDLHSKSWYSVRIWKKRNQKKQIRTLDAVSVN